MIVAFLYEFLIQGGAGRPDGRHAEGVPPPDAGPQAGDHHLEAVARPLVLHS